MAKAKLKQKEKATPYSRKNKKPITKSEKIKNAGITEDLDNLMGDLTEHLTAKKKKKIQIKSDTMEDDVSYFYTLQVNDTYYIIRTRSRKNNVYMKRLKTIWTLHSVY